MRNRMVKPEFWQSKTLRKCSLEARLLFVGLWNFCDDYGVCLNSNRKILGEIFPFDENISEKRLEKWKSELIINKLLIEIEQDGTKYLIVRSWNEHQKVDRPSPRRYILEEIQTKIIEEFNSSTNIVESNSPNTSIIIPRDKQKQKEKEKEKVNVRESVSLFEDEINKLTTAYGKEFVEKCFDKLNNYKLAKGTNYKSDYRAILNWVVDSVKEKTKPKPVVSVKDEKYYDKNKRSNTDKETKRLEKIYNPEQDGSILKVAIESTKVIYNPKPKNEDQKKRNEDFAKRVDKGEIK